MFALGQLVMVTTDGRHVRAVDVTYAKDAEGLTQAAATPAWWLARVGTQAPAAGHPWAGKVVATLPAQAVARAVLVTGRRASLLVLTDAALLAFDRRLARRATVALPTWMPGVTWLGARGIRAYPGGTVMVLAAVRDRAKLAPQYVVLECSPSADALRRRIDVPGQPLAEDGITPFAVDGRRLIYVGLNERGARTIYTWTPAVDGGPATATAHPAGDDVQAIVPGPFGRILTRESPSPSRKTDHANRRAAARAQALEEDGEPLPTPPSPDDSQIAERDALGSPTGRRFPTGSAAAARMAPSLNGFWLATSVPAAAGVPAQLRFTQYDWDGSVRQQVNVEDFT